MVAPVRRCNPPSDTAAFESNNIVLRPIRESGGETFAAKLSQAIMAPQLLLAMWRNLGGVDAIHVRCPGNVGLLGILVAPLRSSRLIAKFAGQWGEFEGESWTVRLQRWLLRSSWWKGPVTVFGRQENDPPHVTGFFASVMSDAQIKKARAVARGRVFSIPLRVLYVGRLSRSKRVDAVIEATALLSPEIVACCTIVGDGPERAVLEEQASRSSANDRIRFLGAISHDEVMQAYASHDILVLVSNTEGWPKVITEAMAHGMMIVGSDRGETRRILRDGRGMLVQPGDAQHVANAILAFSKPQVLSDLQQSDGVDEFLSRESLRAALIPLFKAWSLP